MSYNPSINPKNKNNKNFMWPVIIILIMVVILFLFSIIYISQTESEEASNSIQNITMELQNKTLENPLIETIKTSIQNNLGEKFGKFTVEPQVTPRVCSFILYFNSKLVQSEALEAGTQAIKTILKEYSEAGNINSIIEGKTLVSVWIYSLEFKTGILKDNTLEPSYIGTVLYEYRDDSVEWKVFNLK